MIAKINVGDKFKCIETVHMKNNVNNITYVKDKIYKCEHTGCITDEHGCQKHFWGNIEYINKYFIKLPPTKEDRVNHPSHYTWLKDKCGIEVIDITRHMNFNLGNVVKYVLRSGHKFEQGMSDKQKQIEDLKKAKFYIEDEINKLENDRQS